MKRELLVAMCRLILGLCFYQSFLDYRLNYQEDLKTLKDFVESSDEA